MASRSQVAKIQREHDAREVELRKAQEHYESIKKTAGPSAECAHALLKCLCGPCWDLSLLEICVSTKFVGQCSIGVCVDLVKSNIQWLHYCIVQVGGARARGCRGDRQGPEGHRCARARGRRTSRGAGEAVQAAGAFLCTRSCAA